MRNRQLPEKDFNELLKKAEKDFNVLLEKAEKDFNVLLETAACYDIIKKFLNQVKNNEMTDSDFTEHVKYTIDVATDRLDKINQ